LEQVVELLFKVLVNFMLEQTVTASSIQRFHTLLTCLGM